MTIATTSPDQADVWWVFLLEGIAALLFGLYYLNWTYGWVTPDDLDLYHPG